MLGLCRGMLFGGDSRDLGITACIFQRTTGQPSSGRSELHETVEELAEGQLPSFCLLAGLALQVDAPLAHANAAKRLRSEHPSRRPDHSTERQGGATAQAAGRRSAGTLLLPAS